MQNRKIIYGILLGLFLLAVILSGIIFVQRSKEMEIIFFDVGQGDAILIAQGGNQVLIDGGKSGQILLEKLGKYMPFWDRKIETVIATHPDQDHVGGLIDVAQVYQIGSVIETNAGSDSQVFRAWEEEIEKERAQRIEAVKDTAVKFPEGGELKIIFPFVSISQEDTSDTNAKSVVAKLIWKDSKFLFTGDLPNEKETELISSQADLKANVLKVGHHGSKYSTSQEFLDAVSPQETIISVGKNNTYGHPAPEILERFQKKNIKIWRTDELGDIMYQCKKSEAICRMVAN